MKKFNGAIQFFEIEYPQDGYNGGFIKTLTNPTRKEFESLKMDLDKNLGEHYMINFYPTRPKLDIDNKFDQGEEEVLLYLCGKDPVNRKMHIRFHGGEEPKKIQLILTEDEFLDFHSESSWTKKIKSPFRGFETRQRGNWSEEQLWEGASHGMEVKSPFTGQFVTVWEPTI